MVSLDSLEDLAGAPPDDDKNRPSSAKQGTQGLHWCAEEGGRLQDHRDEGANNRDREERLRIIKEKQNEDRQRKLEELKQQALAAQKFREQKEEERKKRLEELRARDCDRRAQVEERKRQIWEAERDRREAILRKNQEREARIEAKRKNERSSIVFAFGSSTPRMLEPGETSSYWATRRATSTTNVMTLSMSAAAPLTRRSSERELEGSKKRATSAGGIERKSPLDYRWNSSSIYEVFQWGGSPPLSLQLESQSRGQSDEFDGGLGSSRRKKTDLTPTLPSPRESSNPNMSASRSFKSMRSGEATPSRPLSSMSQHSVASNLSQASAHLRSRQPGTPRRPRPVSIAVTGVSSIGGVIDGKTCKANTSGTDKPPIPKVHASKKSGTPKSEPSKKPTDKVKSAKSSTTSTPKGSTPVQSPSVENMVQVGEVEEDKILEESPEVEEIQEQVPVAEIEEKEEIVKTPVPTVPGPTQSSEHLSESTVELDRDSEMNTSMSSKTRITTEEEAKAALAERRRLAREQAEREAELERQRLEAERLAEEERLRKEEEEQRRMEEEQLKLLEEAKKAEELRLQQAIEEAQKREEEERKRKEEEAKLKLEKEEAEKKAKEEAEKLRQEMEIRLKKEEEDRQARRKRVEAIMLRTRSKGSTSTTTPTKDGEDGSDGSPPNDDKMQSSLISESDKFLDSERNHTDANSHTKRVETTEVNNKHNGHHNGSLDSVVENNVTNNLLDLSSEPVGEILDLPGGNGKITDPQIQTSFIGFQEKSEPPTVNDLLS